MITLIFIIHKIKQKHTHRTIEHLYKTLEINRKCWEKLEDDYNKSMTRIWLGQLGINWKGENK